MPRRKVVNPNGSFLQKEVAKPTSINDLKTEEMEYIILGSEGTKTVMNIDIADVKQLCIDKAKESNLEFNFYEQRHREAIVSKDSKLLIENYLMKMYKTLGRKQAFMELGGLTEGDLK